jgi:type II secretory pathway component PulF
MQVSAEPINSFAYEAQTRDGHSISGTIEAIDVEEASHRLEGLQLRVLEISPLEGRIKSRALSGDDFLAFNQQLAHLTSAGLPLERGLRLIAQDMRSGRLAKTIQQIAQELEAGKSLGEAFEAHQAQFPSLYAKLVEAGVRSNNLPGMLFGLSRHLEMVRRLRAMMWRAAAYPLMVLAGLAVVLIFLGMFVLPQFEAMFNSVRMPVPMTTQFLLGFSRATPLLVLLLVLLFVAGPIAWGLLRWRRLDRWVVDHLLLPMPLFGAILTRNLIAGWCDALRLGVEAGLDLPRAISLAGDASGSPRLRQDGEEIIYWLERGEEIDRIGRGSILPATVIVAIGLGMQHHDLPETLRSLTEMYQEQAETRLGMLPGIISPILLLFTAGVIGLVAAGMILPVVRMISWVSSGRWF